MKAESTQTEFSLFFSSCIYLGDDAGEDDSGGNIDGNDCDDDFLGDETGGGGGP